MRSWAPLLALIAGSAVLFAANGCNQKAGAHVAPAIKTSALDRVTAGKPHRTTLLLSTSQPARIEAFETTPLYAKLAGYVHQVHVDIGDVVVEGQLLVTLAIPELVDDVAQKNALVAQAEAEIEQAVSNVETVRAAAETAQARIAEARAGVGRARGEHDRSKAEYDRMKKLADSGSVTAKLVDEMRNQYQGAEAAHDAALASVQSAEAIAKQAQANIRKAQADQTAAEARLRVAQADVTRAKTMLSYAEIKAPFNGVVTSRSIDSGHFVQPAGGSQARPLLVVARTDKVRVFMDVPEMEAALVDVGDPVTLRVQALGTHDLDAAVTRTSWSLSTENRSLRVEADVSNDNGSLRPGMYAAATILLQRRENVLALPSSAIVRVGDETYCCCVDSGKIVRRRVQLGLRSGPEVELLSGADDSSTVVLTRADALADGQPVEVIAPPK